MSRMHRYGKYSELKLIQLLLILRKEGTVGRYHLKELLDLKQHEGIVRRMLEDLVRMGWVRPTPSGCTLTTMGDSEVDQLLRDRGISNVKETNLLWMNVGPKNVALQMSKKGAMKSVLALRDEAVRVGAKGAVILVYESDDLRIPSVYESLMQHHPWVFKELEKEFAFSEGDVLVIGFAETASKALEGALAIALAANQNETNK